jgi:hypothetical protein
MVNFSEDDSASVKTTSLYDLVQSELIDKGLIKNSRDNKPLVFLQFKTNDYENKLGFEDNYGDYTTSIDCQIMVVLSPMDFDFNVIPEDLVAVYGMDA